MNVHINRIGLWKMGSSLSRRSALRKNRHLGGPAPVLGSDWGREAGIGRSFRDGRLPPCSGAGSGFVAEDRVSRPVPTRSRRRAVQQSQVTDPP